jgi:hypothetical protein
MIKRLRDDLLTYLYVKYVVLPSLEEEIDHMNAQYGLNLNPKYAELEQAMIEKDYSTLQ